MKAYQKKSALSREKMLAALRDAREKNPLDSPPYPQENENSPVFFEESSDDILETFLQNFEQIQGKAHRVKSEEEAKSKLSSIIDAKEWEAIFCKDPAFQSWIDPSKLQTELDDKTQASVTACDYMIARTGSLFITSALAAGRKGTIYPPEHLVIAYKNQLLRDISDALEKLSDYPEIPSMINLNTGPSRTADIEKTLVVGIHGPKEVNLILIEN